jgi:virginiamycin B lyase
MAIRLPLLALVTAIAGCSSADVSPSATASVAPTITAAPTESSTPSAEATESATAELGFSMETYPIVAGSRPHDVAPAEDGGVWYTGQGNGTLGWLDPETGEVREIPLGQGSSPHGVIVGPDGDAWITDGGLNAIVRVDAETDDVTVFPVEQPNANLNTAAFDRDGILWFTGQAGLYGSLDPETGDITVRTVAQGPYGIAATPDGEIYFSSLAASYLGAIDRPSADVTLIATPTPGGGARRVWADSEDGLWVTEWFAGALARYDAGTDQWTEWPVPGDNPMPYAVYVDERDAVWVTDFGANTTWRFDPATEEWLAFEHDSSPAEVRQLLGRTGEVWGAESAADQLVVIRTGG